MKNSEHERIARLREIFSANRAKDAGTLLTGIGDDAAVLAPTRAPWVVSVDAHVENVHFTRALLTFEEVGFRATMAALSDLAAMGAEPLGVLASITLPANERDATLFDIARGQRDAAAASGTEVIGGNLSRGEAVSISTTVLGSAMRPILRSGARAGDRLLLGGPVGLAAAGLRIAQKGAPRTEAEEAAVEAFKRPLARIALGLEAARGGVTAMIDVSDGLGADADHIAKESGVDIIVEEAALEDPRLVELARTLACPWTDLALHGGEDFALLATIGEGPIPEGMRIIGRCAESTSPKVLSLDKNGTARPIEPRGFDHFTAP